MCGIAGFLVPAAAGQRGDLDVMLGRMVECQHHRGPDGRGQKIVAEEGAACVGLGHNRLAIIDLSPSGSQPMASADGPTLITFNGEIYNFKSVRAALGDEGWRSQSDTEVILRAYARWGRDCLEHLRGMFAFALWDAQRRELFLARDRVGIKPLYYSRASDGTFLFASEVRSLLASGLIRPRLDSLALSQY